MVDGDDAIAKSGPGPLVVLLVVVVAEAAETWITTSTLWVKDKLAPVSLKVNDPVEALGSAVRDNGEAEVLPEGGVMGEVIATFTPDGAVPTQELTRMTGELNALSEVTVIVAEPLPP